MIVPLKMHLLRVIIIAALYMPGRAGAVPVDIRIRPVVVGQPLLLDSLRYAKSGEEKFSVSRLSYLVSGLALQRPDGTWVEPEFEVAWLDAVKRRNAFRVENVPRGRYVALRFAIGLSEQANTADPASFPAGRPHLRRLRQGQHLGAISTSGCCRASPPCWRLRPDVGRHLGMTSAPSISATT